MKTISILIAAWRAQVLPDGWAMQVLLGIDGCADTDFLNRVRAADFKDCVIEEFLWFRRTHPQSLIAHKDTNFKSSYHIEMQERTLQYQQQYQTGELDCTIEPICAQDADYLEPKHHG